MLKLSSNVNECKPLFVGGPATDGGGQVVGKDLEQAMRSHKVGRYRLNLSNPR